MLYVHDKVGTQNGIEFDIAVDPLEGTNFTAKNLPNSLSVMAISTKGNMLKAPDMYMEKIAIGPNYPKNLVDLDFTIEKNINLLADSKKKNIKDLTACLLKRPRH
jgi:fructose-1,6-bisphosphatase II / sedoheptulose-1,7-bisphosphatase